MGNKFLLLRLFKSSDGNEVSSRQTLNMHTETFSTSTLQTSRTSRWPPGSGGRPPRSRCYQHSCSVNISFSIPQNSRASVVPCRSWTIRVKPYRTSSDVLLLATGLWCSRPQHFNWMSYSHWFFWTRSWVDWKLSRKHNPDLWLFTMYSVLGALCDKLNKKNKTSSYYFNSKISISQERCYHIYGKQSSFVLKLPGFLVKYSCVLTLIDGNKNHFLYDLCCCSELEQNLQSDLKDFESYREKPGEFKPAIGVNGAFYVLWNITTWMFDAAQLARSVRPNLHCARFYFTVLNN